MEKTSTIRQSSRSVASLASARREEKAQKNKKK